LGCNLYTYFIDVLAGGFGVRFEVFTKD